MENISKANTFAKLRDIAAIALMAAVISVSSWITVPYTVPFTMQTFAVFLALLLLGGRRGTVCVTLYVLTGAAGVPVFSGFRGGIGVLAGPTGGYITGFILASLLFWLFEKRASGRRRRSILLSFCLIICYIAGTIQFMLVMNSSGNGYGLLSALTACVFPYVIPDIVKIILADIAASKIGRAAGL